MITLKSVETAKLIQLITEGTKQLKSTKQITSSWDDINNTTFLTKLLPSWPLVNMVGSFVLHMMVCKFQLPFSGTHFPF